MLKDALAALKAATGLSRLAAFEQEFHALPTPAFAPAPPHAFSLEALRRADPFAPQS